jgi:uncharacterized membrane protein YqiK
MTTRMALTTTKKGMSSIAEFFIKMKGLADNMASAGRKLEDEELMTFILMGLGEDFETIVSAIASRVEPISVIEQRKEIKIDGSSQSSVNAVTKGGRGGHSSSPNQPHGRHKGVVL